MSPPCYSDLGKNARDIFSRNYNFGLIKINCKTKSPTGVEFQVGGISNLKTGNFDGNLETKYHFKDSGATLKEKWTTANIVTTDVTVDNLGVKGLKVGVGANFSPNTGAKKVLVRSGFKNDLMNLALDMDMDSAAWIVNSSLVSAYKGWLLGAQVNLDARARTLNKTNFALGYTNDDIILHTSVHNGTEFGGSVYQKVNKKLESGVQISWTNAVTKFGFGCVYKLDPETQLRAMINNSSLIGLGITHTLKPGIKLHLSAHIDGKTLTQGGHKLGLGLDLEG